MFVAIWQVSCDPDGYFLIWSCIIKLSPWSLTHKPLERISVQVLYLLCTGCNVTSLGSCHINIQSCKKYSGVKKKVIAYLHDNLNNAILLGTELWNISVPACDSRCLYECALNIAIQSKNLKYLSRQGKISIRVKPKEFTLNRK